MVISRNSAAGVAARWWRNAGGLLAMAVLTLSSMMATGPVQAEGTRTLHPAGATGHRGVMDVGGGTNFAGIVPSRQFLYVYAQENEVILLGSRNRSNGGNILVYNPTSFGPPGAETWPAASFSCDTQTGRGTIGSRAEELAGPNSADLTETVPEGFDPCWYVAPTTGIYGVRFTAATGGGGANNASIENPPVLEGGQVAAWDITVRSDASSLDDLDGRVFTYAWTVYLQANQRRLFNDLYYISSDGYRYRQTFRGLDPNRAAFYANARGFIDTDGRPLYRDLRGGNAAVTNGPSITAGITAQRPQYPIFFSDVSATGPNTTEVNRVLTALAIPHTPAQPILTNPDFVGNVGGSTSTVSAGGVFTFSTQNTLTYEVVISRDGTDFDPANVLNRVLTGIALTGDHNVLWDGRDNNGDPFPVGDYLFRIVGRNGEIHFPMIDVEANFQGGPTLTKLNGSQGTTVYYDDRGYRAANSTLIGALNGHLCGASSPIAQPVPTYSLVGVDSADGNLSGSGNYYRSWAGSNDANNDCNNNANEFFGTAKGLDLWALERSMPTELPIEIIDPTDGVDVGTMVSVTSAVLPGETAYGSFVFTNAGDETANGVTYAVSLGNPADPDTCPAAVNFTLVPAGVTPTYNPAPACTITFTGMPTTLAPGESLNFNFNYVVLPSNPGPIPITANIEATNENNDVAPNTATAQTVVARPVITVAKSSSPPPGTAVEVGDTLTYTLGVTIANAPLTEVLTLADALGTGLTFGTITDSHPDFNCSGSLTCTLPIGTAMGTYSVTYTAAVNASAGNTVANNVTATGGGGEDPPGCAPCSVEHPLDAEPFPFCPAAGDPAMVFSLVNGVEIYGYTAGSATPDTLLPLTPRTITSNLNALMLDSVRNRLLMIQHSGGQSTLWAYDAANGGWYQAFGPFASADFPRGGFNQAGTGYLLTGGTSPQIWEVESSSMFGYTVSEIGTVNYDNPPTDAGSGDIAFDGNGLAWLAVGQDIWTLDLSGTSPFTAVRQTRPLLGGAPSTINWAGIAFADDGTLILANNAPSPSAYYQYDPAAGVIEHRVDTTADASRDLTSCAFPIPQEPELSVEKTLAEVNGSAFVPGNSVYPGDVLTYAIIIENSGGAVATLFAGDVQETVPTGTTHAGGDDFTCTGANCANTNAFNVPAGDSVTIEFSVAIDDPLPAGVTSIANAVTVEDVDCDDPGNDCEETTPIGPTVTYGKTSNPASGTAVSTGDTITYTLSVNVSVAPTQSPVVLTDTLGAGLTVVTPLPAGCSATLQVVTCTLATGATPAGSPYTFVYQAIVGTNATVAVNNGVTATGGGDPGDPGYPGPGCMAPGGCETEHPLRPAVTYAKTSNPASGMAVSAGDTITYTLTVNVSDGPTQSDVVLTDTLGTGLTVVTPLPAGCSAGGQVVTCTLATGATPTGSPYTFVYQATVNTDATVSVQNGVTATGGGDPGDPGYPGPGCTAPGNCETGHPLRPSVTYGKTANPPGGTGVSAGDTITYTLTVNVSGTSTQSAVVLTDTLGAGLTVVMPLPTDCVADTQVVTCTLAAGATPAGSPYTFVYQATVDADATVSVENTVTATGGGDPGDPGYPGPGCTAPGGCETGHPLDPAVTYGKTSDPASGTTVSAGETITYTLSVNVSGSPTQSDVVLIDTLGAGLTVVTPLPTGCSAGGQVVTCTLATGATPAGSPHTFVYQATLDADATVAVGNSVTATGGGGPGDPGPGCTAPGGCETEHPVRPSVTYAKTANPPSGTGVSAGETITYTLTVNVSGGPTQSDVLLTDTLGAGLTVVTPLPTGCSAGGQVVTCTLATGATPAGSPYTFVYEATVDADATVAVNNSVTATGGGDPGDPGYPGPGCTAPGGCETGHPLGPTVTYGKTANPPSGTGVSAGETITYTLTVNVSGGPTQSDVVLTDTLGASLTVVTPLPTGCSAGGQVVTCTLAVGATPTGSPYTFVYQATVDADAAVAVNNTVTATGGGGPGDPGPSCTVPGACETEHPLGPTVTYGKTANPPSGTSVSAGETITYTLTVNVSGGPTQSDVVLTDTLGAGLTVVTPLPTGCSAGGQVVTCTLATGATPAGSPYTFVYQATVDADATIAVNNTVTATGGGGPGDPVPGCTAPGACQTGHPLGPAVTVAKTVVDASGDGMAEPGETLTYTITLTNTGGTDASGFDVTDNLDPNTTFVSASNGGSHAAGVVTWSGLTVPAQVGSTPGVLTLTLVVTVNDPLPAGVSLIANLAYEAGTVPPDCPATPTPAGCATIPVGMPEVAVSKVANVSQTQPNGTVVYTITVANVGTVDVTSLTISDPIPAGVASFSWTCAGSGGGVCANDSGTGAINELIASFPVGGVLTYTVTAQLTANPPSQILNIVSVTPGETVICQPEGTPSPCSADVPVTVVSGTPGDPRPVPLNNPWALLALLMALLAVAGRTLRNQRQA